MGKEIKPGDVVYLKSGGSGMTAGTVTNDGYVWCKWFVQGEVKAGNFQAAQLTTKDPTTAGLAERAYD